MIELTEQAGAYLRQLLEQQDEPGLGLRIRVLNAGTPGADCELLFCAAAETGADDTTIEQHGVPLYLEAGSLQWLDDAQIEYTTEATGGQLQIKAPNIKGHSPAEDASLAERVAWVVDTEITTMVAAHGGNVSLQHITDAGEAVLRFGGGCQGCGMVGVTLKQGVEKTLQAHFPEITGVIDATDHATGENPYYSA